MSSKTNVSTVVEQASDFEHKVQKLRDLYADASDFSKAALEKVIRALGSDASAAASPTETGSAGRIGARAGQGLGVDGDLAAQARRSEAHACVPSVAWQSR